MLFFLGGGGLKNSFYKLPVGHMYLLWPSFLSAPMEDEGKYEGHCTLVEAIEYVTVRSITLCHIPGIYA